MEIELLYVFVCTCALLFKTDMMLIVDVLCDSSGGVGWLCRWCHCVCLCALTHCIFRDLVLIVDGLQNSFVGVGGCAKGVVV